MKRKEVEKEGSIMYNYSIGHSFVQEVGAVVNMWAGV